MPDDLDDKVDELFAAPAEEFVARRDGLVKELRASGDRARAAEVKALRRPTLAAWAVNQVVRRHSGEVAALRDLSSRLREAQEGLLTGRGGGELRSLTSDRRAIVAQLADAAVAALGPAGPGQREAVTATFDAAAADAAAAELALSGRLTKELPKPSGFGDLGIELEDLTPERPTEDDRAAALRRERLERLQDEAERAEHEVADATARVERLEADLRTARERRDDARARAARAARALEDAGGL